MEETMIIGQSTVHNRINKTYLFLSFTIPFVIMLISIMVMRVTPFGEHSFALTDGKYYLNTLLFDARLFRGQENFFYSFSGLGINNWAWLSWGEFNPVKLLGLFATIDTVPVWITWISIVNMSVCGLTMYIMLSGLYGYVPSHLLFSTSYAMMGFNVANCFQMLFFIGPQMLPLVVLGLIRLLRGKAPFLYTLSLFFCIFCNFYFGLMLCIASVVIFITYNYVFNSDIKKNRKRIFITYGISSIIAGMMASFFWLPAIKALSGGGRLDQTVATEYELTENMPFIQIFSKLFTGANSAYEEIQGLPNIFCGMLVVLLVVMFFMNRAVSKRMKYGVAAVLTLYLLTFYIKAFTLIMHGFTHTNWFPYRYSFVFSFFMIWIAAKQFEYINQIKLSEVKRCGLIIVLATIIIFSTRYEYISGGEVLIDLSVLALFIILFQCWKKKPEPHKWRVGTFALILIVSFNLLANYVLSIQKLQKTDGWELNLEKYQGNTLLSGSLIDGINNYDHGFYRMEKDFSESSSIGADPYLYNYNGVSASGPQIRMFVHKQLNKLGINWYDMRHWYSEGIPAATDALLGIKYIISEKDLKVEKNYEELIKLNEGHIYRNPNALSVSVLTEGEIIDFELGNNAFVNLNHVWKLMTGGQEDIFIVEKDVSYELHNQYENRMTTSEELAVSVSNSITKSAYEKSPNSEDETHILELEEETEPVSAYIECSFIATQDGPVYYYDTAVPASEMGRSVPCIEFLGVYKIGERVTHNFVVGDDITWFKMKEYASTLSYAYADNSVLEKYTKELNDKDITCRFVHENDIKGTFVSGTNQRILFTVPWDEGWTCYIDGQKIHIDKTWDLFMSVSVPAGEHTYEMIFIPAWLNYGLLTSGAAFAALVVLMVVWRKITYLNKTRVK